MFSDCQAPDRLIILIQDVHVSPRVLHSIRYLKGSVSSIQARQREEKQGVREEAVPLSWPDRPSMRVITASWQNFAAFPHMLAARHKVWQSSVGRVSTTWSRNAWH